MKRKKLPFTLMLAALSSFAVGHAFFTGSSKGQVEVEPD